MIVVGNRGDFDAGAVKSSERPLGAAMRSLREVFSVLEVNKASRRVALQLLSEELLRESLSAGMRRLHIQV